MQNSTLNPYPGTQNKPALLQRRAHLELVDAAQGVRDGPHADHDHDLRQALAVGLDVVSAPQHHGDGLCPKFFSMVKSEYSTFGGPWVSSQDVLSSARDTTISEGKTSPVFQ